MVKTGINFSACACVVRLKTNASEQETRDSMKALIAPCQVMLNTAVLKGVM